MTESGDIDALAAEYVLGTLDAGERARAQKLLPADQALAAKVRIWERRLSELHLMVEPIEPEDEIWDRIRRKVPWTPPSVAVPVSAPVAAAKVAAPPMPSEPPAPMPEFKPPPTAEFKLPPAPEARPAPTLPASSAFGAPPVWEPAPLAEQSATVRDRPSLESLEEAVLRAADDLQRRAAAEPAIEPVGEPREPVVEAVVEAASEMPVEPVAKPAPVVPADAGSEEAAGKPAEDAGSVPQEVAKSAEESPKTPETAPPVPAADAEPAPSAVSDDLPEPKPAGPLAAFPTPFTATAPSSAAAPAVPAASATLTVPVPGPAVAVRPSERRVPPPATKSRWLARTVATLATLILLTIAGLVAAWRFAPERVPVPLQPVELLRAVGIAVPTIVVGPPPRKPAPPESQYEE